MKKLFTLAFLVVMLAGCASNTTYTSKVTDGSSVMATVGNASISKQDLYECLMDANGVEYVLNEALTQIASLEELDQATIDAEVSSIETSWKAILGDDINSYVKSYFGYETFEDYKEAILIPSARQIVMIKDYVLDNYDTLAKQFMFVKCRAIYVADEATGMEALSKINNKEMSFEDALMVYSTDTTNLSNQGQMGLISDLSTCTADSSIVAILPQLTKKGLYSMPLQLSTGKYAVLEILETDITALKEEILAELNEAEEVVTEAESYFLKQNGFKVNDKFLETEIKALYPSYFE